MLPATAVTNVALMQLVANVALTQLVTNVDCFSWLLMFPATAGY